MKYRLFILMVLFVFLVSFVGCSTFNNYKPKTAAEEEIMVTLVKFINSWNHHDADGVLSVFHEDAQIMTKKYHNVLSKQKFSTILPERMRKNSPLGAASPEMDVNGDEATVTIFIGGVGIGLNWVMELVREDSKWYIMNAKL